MTRDRGGEIAVWAAMVLLCAAAIARYAERGGPFVERPRTVLDHVDAKPHALRHALLVVPRAAALIPRGAKVAVVRVTGGRPHDDGSYMASVGLLPHHVVLPPFTTAGDVPPANLPDYVIALGEPFDHPHYAVTAGLPNAWLYQVKR